MLYLLSGINNKKGDVFMKEFDLIEDSNVNDDMELDIDMDLDLGLLDSFIEEKKKEVVEVFGVEEKKKVNYKRTNNTASVLFLSLKHGDVIKDKNGTYYEFIEADDTDKKNIKAICKIPLCLTDDGYAYSQKILKSGYEYTKVSKEEYNGHLSKIKDNRTKSNTNEEETDTKYTLGVTVINGEIALVLKNGSHSEIINASKELSEKLIQSYVTKKYNKEFSKSQELTSTKCDHCGKFLEKRTLDYINRMSHKHRGTEKEGLYYCIHCQIVLFNRKFY